MMTPSFAKASTAATRKFPSCMAGSKGATAEKSHGSKRFMRDKSNMHVLG